MGAAPVSEHAAKFISKPDLLRGDVRELSSRRGLPKPCASRCEAVCKSLTRIPKPKDCGPAPRARLSTPLETRSPARRCPAIKLARPSSEASCKPLRSLVQAVPKACARSLTRIPKPKDRGPALWERPYANLETLSPSRRCRGIKFARLFTPRGNLCG